MAEDLSLQESVLVYLDTSGGLEKLTEDCRRFNGRTAGRPKHGSAVSIGS